MATEADDWRGEHRRPPGGVWKATTASILAISKGGQGDSITIASSAMGVQARPSSVEHTVAKHGVLGLIRESFGANPNTVQLVPVALR